jgi:hypothetical protein
VTLPAPDAEYLAQRDLQHEVVTESGMTCVVLPRWQLPPGLNQPAADLLVRLQPGYPDLPPDMWWFSPGVLLANGSRIQATEVTEHHLGRDWQRWSRHLQPGQWRSGIDGLESYLALVDRELARATQGAA